MRRRVNRDRVRLGMFIESFVGSWFDHPFWRSRFLLTDPEDLQRILDSKVEAVMIDLDRGVGPEERRVRPADAPVVGTGEGEPIPARRVEDRRAFAAYRPHDEGEFVVNLLKRSTPMVKAMFAEARMGRAVSTDLVGPLIDEITGSIERDRAALIRLTRLKTKNEYTFLHSIAVSGLMINLGRQIGLDADTVRLIGIGGLLHDIGKTKVPDSLLDKAGTLTDAELAVMRTHPGQGHALLSRDATMPAIVLDVCLHHHERIDGTGYPMRLKGDAISLPARIAAICDVYDAVTSNRPYKRAWTPAEALARMMAWRGHFDRGLLRVFVASLGIYPLGALVRLRTNRLGLVVRTTSDPYAPVVRAFYATREPGFVDPVDVTITEHLGGDQIVALEEPGDWFAGDWTLLSEAVLARRRIRELRAIATPIAMAG